MEPKIARLGHVGLFVEDVARSLAFYRDVLGLVLTDADEQNGMYFLSARPAEDHHEFLLCAGLRKIIVVASLLAHPAIAVAQHSTHGPASPSASPGTASRDQMLTQASPQATPPQPATPHGAS